MLRFSPFVIKALADVITGGGGNDQTPPIGLYRPGYKIQEFFLDCGLALSIGSSSRVPATTDFLREVASRDDGGIERILVRVADPRDYLADPAKGQAVLAHLNAALEADEFAIVIANGKSQLVPRSATGAIVAAVIAKTALFDFDTVQREITRAQQSAANDPEDAVTAACSLIESVCRSILIELSLPLPPKRDIDGLVKAVQEPLGLSPGRKDISPEIEVDVRQVLGGLTSVAKGVGALRTHGGDAHGREKGVRRIDPRIAKLSINAAGTLALFFIETWEQRQHRALPLRKEAA